MSYSVIKNAGPVPPITHSSKGGKVFTPKYPLHLLGVGDAFDVEGEGEPDAKGCYKNWNPVSVMASRYGKSNGKKFSCRRVSSKVLRVWRIL